MNREEINNEQMFHTYSMTTDFLNDLGILISETESSTQAYISWVWNVCPGDRFTITSHKVQWILDEARVGLEIQKSCLEEGEELDAEDYDLINTTFSK